MFFQDYAGSIHVAQWQVALATRQFALSSGTTQLNVNAANGTGLAALELNHNYTTNTSSVLLVYVNTDGFLADLYQPSGPLGSWQPGNLSKIQAPAPTENRPTMNMRYDQAFDDSARLFAGGADGQIHGYSYNLTTMSWTNVPTHNFSGTWAYGGFAEYSSPSPTEKGDLRNTTVFLSHQSGEIWSFQQKVGDDSIPVSPGLESWTSGFASGIQTAPNSSFAISVSAANTSSDLLIFPTVNSTLGALSLTTSYDDPHGSFGTLTTALRGHSAMPGSAFESAVANGNLLVYQDNGTSLAWVILGSNQSEFLGSGHIGLNQNNQWFSATEHL